MASSRAAKRPLVLVWDHVLEGTAPPTERVGALPGVNTISPTWFHLSDGAGAITSRADREYVSWARGRGLAVWALVGNRHDPELTRRAIATPGARAAVSRRLVELAEETGIDGINVDFENVYPADRGHLVALVEELAARAGDSGLRVSVDVTPPDAGDLAACYDYRGLAAAADHVMLMAYDQHPGSAAGPGPVADLDWTRRVLEATLEDVPASRLVLGMPLYTRLWTTGSRGISSKDLAMDDGWSLVRDAGADIVNEGPGLFRAGWSSGGDRTEIWLEDPEVTRRRASMAAGYGLAGVAAWRLGFEPGGTWQDVATILGPGAG